MSKFKTCWQYQFNIEDCEKNSGEILVTENDCLSVREILERFSKGIPVGEQYRNLEEGTEINEEDIDNIQSPDYSADKADMALYVEQSSQNIIKSKSVSKTAVGDDEEREREQASEQSKQASEQTNDLPDPTTVKE